MAAKQEQVSGRDANEPDDGSEKNKWRNNDMTGAEKVCPTLETGGQLIDKRHLGGNELDTRSSKAKSIGNRQPSSSSENRYVHADNDEVKRDEEQSAPGELQDEAPAAATSDTSTKAAANLATSGAATPSESSGLSCKQLNGNLPVERWSVASLVADCGQTMHQQSQALLESNEIVVESRQLLNEKDSPIRVKEVDPSTLITATTTTDSNVLGVKRDFLRVETMKKSFEVDDQAQDFAAAKYLGRQKFTDKTGNRNQLIEAAKRNDLVKYFVSYKGKLLCG